MLNREEIKVSVLGNADTIANHIKNSTKYSFGTRYLRIGTVNLPYSYKEDFEKMLWYKFFIANKEEKFDGKDAELFKEIIEYHNSERNKIFLTLLKNQNEIPVLNMDIFAGNEQVIGHQTNCQGVMGSGIAKIVKEKFPTCYEEYHSLCNSYENKEDLLGKCQMCKVGNKKYIANLFGQCKYGTDKCYSDYEAFEKALTQLKYECVGKELSVALPYNISCGRAGGDWNIVYNIIKKVFSDYPVILYKI